MIKFLNLMKYEGNPLMSVFVNLPHKHLKMRENIHNNNHKPLCTLSLTIVGLTTYHFHNLKNKNKLPTRSPVSIFLGSCTILLFCCSSNEDDAPGGLFRRRSGAKCSMRLIDFILSFWEGRCIVCLLGIGAELCSGCFGTNGAGGQLPPIKVNKSICKVLLLLDTL